MNEEGTFLDRSSLAILKELQRDARLTVQQLSEAVGLSPTPCWKRVKEMEASGVIAGYTVLVDRERVGLSLVVMAEINLSQHSEQLVRRFEAEVLACPHIVRCVSTTGQADYILTIVMSDIKRYEQFLYDVVFKLPGVTHVRSSIVLKEIKADVVLPIETGAVEHERRRPARAAGAGSAAGTGRRR